MKTLILLAALILVGCATPQTSTPSVHAQMNAIRAKHPGVNIDQWPAADRAEFKRLLILEVDAAR